MSIDFDQLEEAKKLYKLKKYDEALQIYEALWNSSEKNNRYLFTNYGNCLRKCNKPSLFMDEYKKINKDSPLRTNKFVISVLVWCVYDVYIKTYKIDGNIDFDKFIKNAEYIVNNSEQEEGDKEIINPYVLTVKRVVKVYNNRPSSNCSKAIQEQIIKWLKKLEPAILSDKCFTIHSEDKDFEQASSKEFYYYNLVKAYERMFEYEKCISIGNEALNKIEKFHYNNRKWITGRILFSKCKISSSIDEDLNRYKWFAEREQGWFLWYKLASICYSLGRLEESLLYNSKALCCESVNDNMVTLLYNLGLCWQSKNNVDYSKKFFQASAFLRDFRGWVFSEELLFYVFEYNLDVKQKPNMKYLQKISKEYDVKNDHEYLFGTVHNINKEKKLGYIIPSNGRENIRFKMKYVIGKKKSLGKGVKVRYKEFINEQGKSEAISVEGVIN